MARTVAVDTREFARFILTGLTATGGNIAAVWLARLAVPFEIALLAGIFAGIAISFTLSKLFVFRSRSWKRTGVEAPRFLLVYAVGCSLYWAVAVVSVRLVLERSLAAETAEMGGVLLGAATMMVTSYLGHRFITYRTFQRAGERVGGAS
jgi:putative flippase GtrA